MSRKINTAALWAALVAGAPAINAQASPYTASHCQAISQRAESNGIKVMVIGVEGLAQMNTAAFESLYNASETIKEGQEADIPGGRYSATGLTGQAGVTRGLLLPLMRSHGNKVEPISVGQENTSVAQACAEIWMKVKGRKLVIVGHSYGGPGALDLAKSLNARGVNVDALFSIDPVERNLLRPMSAPPRVDFLANYYQTGLNRGQNLPFATMNRQLTGTGHMDIPGDPVILRDLQSRIDGYLNEIEPVKKKHRKPLQSSSDVKKTIAAGMAVLANGTTVSRPPCVP